MTPLDPALLGRLLAPPETAAPVDVVIDTDAANEIDDQFAIVWALLRPDRLRVRALHAAPFSHGPRLLVDAGFLPEVERQNPSAARQRRIQANAVDHEEGMLRSAAECRRWAALCGSDVPVVDGARSVMASPDEPVRCEAVDSLIALAHEDREGPLHVLAIGAATNVSSALLVDPSIRERIVVGWTAAYPTFWPHPNASFNMAQDLHAARLLFDSGVPHVYLPGYYVGEHLRTSRPELREHVQGKGALGDALWDLATSSTWLPDEPGASKVIWDLVNVAWVLDPSWLSTHVVPSPRLTDDLRWADAGPDRHVVREATGVNRNAVWGDLFRVLDERARS